MERRLAAILAADVVGYSRLMGKDETGTLVRLKTMRKELVQPSIAHHKGRVFKLMGDGLLAEFQSVVDAVQCAVDIQQQIIADQRAEPEDLRISLRIGINLGDIIIEGSDVYGDGVNVASRIEGVASPGGVAVSGAAYDHIVNKVDVRFEDKGEHDLKNITRAVRIWEWSCDIADVGDEDGSLALPDKPSIAVLPFDNMSGDAEQEYFADGIAEDIITALSRIQWFFVTARNSSFTYKGRAVDVQEVGRELGVRYVLEGSVRRSGQRLRVTAQLIDAITGKHVWAEKYDRELSDIFEVQDEITRNVVASTQTQIQLSEASLFEQLEKPSLPVWALVNRSWKLMYEMTAESLPEAARLAEEAVALDPGSGRAHQALASALWHWAWMGFADDRDAVLARARKVGERAVRLNSDDEYSHWTLGILLMVHGEYDKAIAEMERAIEINPNCSLAFGSLATVQNFAGLPELAIENNELAIRANPRDPSIFYRYTGLALSHFLLGQFDNAADWARKTVQFKPDWFQGHAVLIASLTESGRTDQAEKAIAECTEQFPGVSLSDIGDMPFRRGSDRDKLVDALRRAGLPE